MVLRTANLVVRFLLELLTLLALGYWGFRTGDELVARIGLAVAAPLSVAVVWGIFGSPAAPVPLPSRARLGLEVVLFGTAAVGLYLVGHPVVAGAFGALVAANYALLVYWEQ